MSWSDYLPGVEPDPVYGRVADYESASHEARQLRNTTDEVIRQFDRIASSSDLHELRGAAAEALGDVLVDIDHSLGDLTPLFDRLDAIFTSHANRLRDLDREVVDGLGRARIRWHRRQDADADLERARCDLDRVRNQIRWLRSADPDGNADRIAELERTEWDRHRLVDRCRDDLEVATDDLVSSRVEHARLSEAERDLVDVTVVGMGAADLGGLSNPTSLLDRCRDLVVGVIEEIVVTVTDVVDDVVSEASDGVFEAARRTFHQLVQVARSELDETVSAVAVALGLVLAAAAVTAVALVAVALGGAVLGALGGATVVAPVTTGVALGRLLGRALQAIGEPDDEGRALDPSQGDLQGTFTERPLPDWQLARDVEVGRAVLTTALAHTAGTAFVARDEFEIITIHDDVGTERYVVILPGVIDLSRPHLGSDRGSRSVRDTDRAALGSSTSTGIDDNPYAQLVYQAMVLHGIEPGDEVMLVGHSFGADTALDLAADPRVNGEGAFVVTHVLAAAYHSGPQMRSIPDGTQLLATQNTNDVVVQGEHAAHGMVSMTDGYLDVTDALLSGDAGRAVTEARRTVEGMWNDTGPLDPLWTTVVPGEYTDRPGQTRIVFAGGTAGFGHDPANYVEHIAGHTSEAVRTFEQLVGSAGYGDPGVSTAVDVSVPVSGVPALAADRP